MPSFSQRSLDRLNTCHPDLQRVFTRVIEIIDCTILEGIRSDERQAELHRQGKSKLDGVSKRSKHQGVEGPGGSTVSAAVDVAPYPIDWGDEKRFAFFAGVAMAVGCEMGIALRWGGDWDGDHDFSDQSFHDLPHFELRL